MFVCGGGGYGRQLVTEVRRRTGDDWMTAARGVEETMMIESGWDGGLSQQDVMTEVREWRDERKVLEGFRGAVQRMYLPCLVLTRGFSDNNN